MTTELSRAFAQTGLQIPYNMAVREEKNKKVSRKTTKVFYNHQEEAMVIVLKEIKEKGKEALLYNALSAFRRSEHTFSEQHIYTAINMLFPRSLKRSQRAPKIEGASFNSNAPIMEDVENFDIEAMVKLDECVGDVDQIDLPYAKYIPSGIMQGGNRAPSYA